MPATQGYVIATLSELPGVRTSQHRGPIPTFPKGKEPFKPPKTQQVGTPATWGGMGRGIPQQLFLFRRTAGFFYRQRRLFDFAPFQPASGQARRWVVADIRERALGNICNHTQTHRAKP
ncbi:MAG TPA: hypothetical protein DCL18_08645 [Prevotella sp.]|nr:hypothetical protein [Prevotella sp.]